MALKSYENIYTMFQLINRNNKIKSWNVTDNTTSSPNFNSIILINIVVIN